ncbi:hypothetical protein Hanom_Chr12g01154591 [Helianthus anomalus]
MSYSASSTEASIRRRTNPIATPTRVIPFMIAAILKISATALQVEVSAPPLDDVFLNSRTMFANCCSVETDDPNEATKL